MISSYDILLPSCHLIHNSAMLYLYIQRMTDHVKKKSVITIGILAMSLLMTAGCAP